MGDDTRWLKAIRCYPYLPQTSNDYLVAMATVWKGIPNHVGNCPQVPLISQLCDRNAWVVRNGLYLIYLAKVKVLKMEISANTCSLYKDLVCVVWEWITLLCLALSVLEAGYLSTFVSTSVYCLNLYTLVAYTSQCFQNVSDTVLHSPCLTECACVWVHENVGREIMCLCVKENLAWEKEREREWRGYQNKLLQKCFDISEFVTPKD